MTTLTWTLQPAPGGITAAALYYLACDPVNGITIITATTGACYRSTDGCQTTNTLTIGGGGTPITVAYGGGTWLAATSTNIRRSTDGGQTWSTISYGTSFVAAQWLCFSPTLGTGSGLWLAVGFGTAVNAYSVSTDGGLTWSANATFSGILNNFSKTTYGPGLIWDGSQFIYSGLRDSGNLNSMFATFNGSSWSTTTVDSIFNPFGDCMITYNSTLAQYVGFSVGSRNIRVSSTLSGIPGTSNVSIAAALPNGGYIQALAPTDLFYVIHGLNSDIAEYHSGTASTDSSPYSGGNRYASSFVWDQKNKFVIGSGSGTSYVLITAPYGGFAVLGPTSGTHVYEAEGGIQIRTTEGSSGTWDVNGIVGGNSTVGTITQTGFYTAPNVAPPNPVVVARVTVSGITAPVNLIITPPFVGGQVLGPRGQPNQVSPNVSAPAGFGGDRWGANGGDQTPAGGGVSGQLGYDRPVLVTMSDCERRTNYQIPPNPSLSVSQQESVTALPTTTPDSSIPAGGS